MRDHHYRGLDRQPILHRAEHEGLGAAAGFPCAGQPFAVHVGQGHQKIQRPDAVPRLEPHQAHIPEQVRLARRKTVVAHVMFVRRNIALIGKESVVIAHHVIGKCNHALPREADAPCRHAPILGIRQPAFFPVPVRVKNRGEWPPAPPERAIQVAGEVKAGQRLEIDPLHAIALALDLAEDLRLQRCFLRHRPQAAAHEHLLANLFGPRLPLLP